jgi:hypothetical protein
MGLAKLPDFAERLLRLIVCRVTAKTLVQHPDFQVCFGLLGDRRQRLLAATAFLPRCTSLPQ